ncbi:MAG TPA: hypothetical protein VMM79_14145 [Longimicrobiales bacterium]|nr:hypothetical protein [Longimicrobiales bacterium]
MLNRFAGVGIMGVACILGSSCDSGAVRSTAVVRDSAGIRIVENTAPLCQTDEVWSIAPEPLVDIGHVDDPEQQLFRVSAATRLSDGRIVIGNSGSSQLRFYDASGNHLMDVGRQGRGPGEFQYVGRPVRGTDDTLHVQGGFNRVLTFDADGNFVRETPAGYMGLFERPWLTEGGRLMPDRTWLLWLYENVMDRPQGAYRPILGFIRFDPATGAQDTLGWFRSGMHEQVGEETRWVAFSPNSTAGWSSRHMYAGDSRTWSIHAYGWDGRLSHIVRMDTQPQPVTAEMKDEFRRSFLDRVASDPRQAANMAMYERTMANLPWAETLPAWRDLRGDEAGNLWVSEDAGTGASTNWNVFGPDGQWLTPIGLPDGVRILELGDDYLLGLWLDELDIEHVRMYDIVKANCS